MTAFQSGDTLTPSTLNRRLSLTTAGQSVNTIQPESGNTLTLMLTRLIVGGGTPQAGSNGYLSICSDVVGVDKDGIVITPTLSGSGGPLGIYCNPQISGADDGVNGMGAAYFGAQTVSTGSVVSQWNSLTLGNPGIVGGGSIVSSYGLLVSDFTNATKNYAIYTGKGQIRFGDTSRYTDGSAVAPSIAMDSEVSLGFLKSAASTIAQSYGTFATSGLSATNLVAVSSLSVNATGIGFKADTSGITLTAGAATNAVLFGTSLQTGKGQGMLHIGNCGLTPSVNPSGGGLLFARGGALLWLGTSGSLTTIATA